MQFKCNSANHTSQFWIMIGWKTIGNFQSQCYVILSGNIGKSFLKWEKMALRKVFQHFLHKILLMFILLISNHRVFLIQFGIDLHLWVFRIADIALAKAARTISAFWKTHLQVQINSKLNEKNPMITYTYITSPVMSKYISFSWHFVTSGLHCVVNLVYVWFFCFTIFEIWSKTFCLLNN